MIKALRQYLRFDAIEQSGKRRRPSSRVKTADQLLSQTQRSQLIESARDLQRNFSIAAWAIRRHLDYVATFSFQAKTGDESLDAELSGLMEAWARPLNCHSAQRFSLHRMVRMLEATRVVDGDAFLLKLRSGQVQPIPGHLVRDPSIPRQQLQDERWVHGIKVDKAGAAKAYAIHSQDQYGTYQYQRTVGAGRIIPLGYYETLNQIRGYSPLASALNSFRDTYENFDYALAKAKVSQLFALAFFRDADESIGAVTEDADSDSDDDVETTYKVDFGQGPAVLDLDPGDRAEFLESRTPSSEFSQFTQQMISAALKSLDLPFSFYDESFTNFFGSRAAFIHYEKSARSKRRDIRELLDRLTLWLINLWIAEGRLPGRAADMRWEWIHEGTPWWDPAKEIHADIKAIEYRLRTRTEIRKERYGDDWQDVVDRQAEEEQYLRSKGLAPQETRK